MMLKNIANNLAFVAVAGYMFVQTMGSPAMWVVGAVGILWVAGTVFCLWHSRWSVVEALRRFPASLRSLFRGIPGRKRGSAAAGLAAGLSGGLTAGIVLLSACGVGRYLVSGERENGMWDGVLALLLVLSFAGECVRGAARRIRLSKAKALRSRR